MIRRGQGPAFLLAGLVAATPPDPAYAQHSISGHPRVVEALRLFDAWLDAEQAYERLPGLSVAIASEGGMVWSKGYGHADVELGVTATPATQYSGCSIAKLFTALAVMQLRDEGKLRLEDPVARYLDWLPAALAGDAPITLAHLLTHSSGLVRDLPGAYWTGPAYPFPGREDILRQASRDWVVAPPGSRHEYSNVGMMLAGEVVATVSGAPYEDHVRERILAPLGMHRTSIAPTDPGGQTGMAQGYTLLQRNGTRERVPGYAVQGLAPVAGLVSTVKDLARFASWQLSVLAGQENEVLRRASLEAMQQVQFMPADSWTTAGYGYQMWRENDRTFVGHAGTCPGFQSQLLLRPQDGFGAVAMINAQGVSPNRYTQRAYDILVPAFRAARADTPGPQDATANEALERLAGVYRRPLGSEVLVLPWQGRLALVTLPTANPLSSMETFDPLGDGRYRRTGAHPEQAEVIEFTPEGNGLRLWRSHQFWRRAP